MNIIPGLENCNIAPFGDIFAHKIIVAYVSFHKPIIDNIDVGDTPPENTHPGKFVWK